MAAITAHNLGVLHVLAGQDDLALPLFEEAIDRKRQEFGADHPEVAISLDEIGIQYFAQTNFSKSLLAFHEARRIRHNTEAEHPKMAMVLNNIACCNFQLAEHEEALQTLQQARSILSEPKADLDLLHVAITHCNYAYLLLRAKQYEQARSIFEEALLVSRMMIDDCVVE